MTLRLSPAQDRALTLLAEASGVSKQEAATRAIISAAATLLADAEVRSIAAELLPEVRAMHHRLS